MHVTGLESLAPKGASEKRVSKGLKDRPFENKRIRFHTDFAYVD